MKKIRIAAEFLIAFGAVAGSVQVSGGDGSGTVPTARKPAVEASYQIGPGDVLSVAIWHEPEASSASVKVRGDGIVTLRLIGEVPVGGLTLREAQGDLVKRYSAYLRDPEITVNIEETNSQVFVVGEVKKSGAIHFVAPITVLQAIAEAGGLGDFARRSKIYVLRQDTNGSVKLPFDYDAVVKGRKPDQNVVLKRGDTIVVPR
ncbi:MAG: polysaccharide biosynthesis/export family protein [Acidobacteriota bacterium]|nr:polysaccharide biosynthesis/export family protein [Acidobacteriota bacterium]